MIELTVKMRAESPEQFNRGVTAIGQTLLEMVVEHPMTSFEGEDFCAEQVAFDGVKFSVEIKEVEG